MLYNPVNKNKKIKDIRYSDAQQTTEYSRTRKTNVFAYYLFIYYLY